MRHIAENDCDTVLRGLIAEARRNVAALHPEALPQVLARAEALPAPRDDGKRCTACRRPFRAAAEYLVCKVCQALVCRKGDCKNLHHAAHRVAHLKEKGTP